MTTKAFEKAFNHTVGVEGGYSDHPSDRGGKTMFGITEAVARSYGYSGDMRSMPLSTAKDIYSKKYWDKLNLDEVSKMSEPLAAKLFDIGVNMGQASRTNGGQSVPDNWLPDGFSSLQVFATDLNLQANNPVAYAYALLEASGEFPDATWNV